MVSKNKSPEWERERESERAREKCTKEQRPAEVSSQAGLLSKLWVANKRGNSWDCFLPPGLLSDDILAPSGHSGKKRVGQFK